MFIITLRSKTFSQRRKPPLCPAHLCGRRIRSYPYFGQSHRFLQRSPLIFLIFIDKYHSICYYSFIDRRRNIHQYRSPWGYKGSVKGNIAEAIFSLSPIMKNCWVGAKYASNCRGVSPRSAVFLKEISCKSSIFCRFFIFVHYYIRRISQCNSKSHFPSC